MKSGLFHRRSDLSPLNRPDVWSRWTSRLEPCSGRRRGWARAWRRGSCEPAGGCCSGTRRSATTHPLRSDPYPMCLGSWSRSLRLTWEVAASNPPLTVPSQSSHEKCLSLWTALRRHQTDMWCQTLTPEGNWGEASLLPAGGSHGRQQKFSVRTWATERLTLNSTFTS